MFFTSLRDRIVRGNSRSTIVKKNIVGSLLIKGVSIIVSMMLVPMTLGYVSSELYGIWLTLSSIMIWLGFFDVGFTLGLKNKLAEAIALNDWQRGKSMVSTTYFMMIAIFIPICLLFELAVPYVNWAAFLNVNPEYNEEIRKALYVLIICFSLHMIVNVLVVVVAAFQKVAFSSAFPVMGNILSLIVIFFLTKLCPPSLFALAFAISMMPVVVVVISSVILYSWRFRRVAPSITCINLSYVKDLFGLGVKFFLIQIQVVVLYQTTNILISNLSGPNEVTTYNIAYKYVGMLMMFFSLVLAPLWPAFTDAYTKKDFKWMNNIYKKMERLYLIVLACLILMVIISPLFYKLWIGNRADTPLIMTITLAFYMAIYMWDSLQVNLINGVGTIKLQTYVTLIGIIFHIPLSFLLGNYFGGYGVIISMIIINIIYVCVFTTQINKILKQKAKGIWAE